MAIFVTNTVQIARFADALFGVTLGSTTMNQVKEDISVAGSLDAVLNAVYYSSFDDIATSTIASNMVANLGITADSTSADAVTLAETYVTAELNSVAATERGAKVKSILDNWSLLTSDETFGEAATAWNDQVTSAVQYAQDNTADIDSDNLETNLGQTFTLTTGVDTVAGTAGNDTINSANDGTDDTLTDLDSIDGGEGTDTLNLIATGAAFDSTGVGGLTVENVENVAIRSSQDAALDTSSWTGVESLSTTVVDGAATFTAAATTDVTVSGVTGAIEIAGGKDVAVTDSTADNAINIGESGAGTTNAAGTISVTDTAQGTGDIVIDGGTDVTATTTVTTGTTTIGGNTASSGAVTVSATGAEATDDNDVTMGAITVTGGTSVDVTVAANADATVAEEFATGTTITQSDVTVNGDSSTTDVTVTQDAVVTEDTYTAAVTGVKETEVVTFVAMDATETTTVNGLTFTASKSLTAEEVAAAFADLANGDTQSAGGPTANGVFTGASDTTAWTTGAADGATVTYTEVTAASGNNLVVADTAAAGNVSVAQGVTATAAVTGNTGVLGVVGGAVTVVDQGGADATIETITLDAYGAASDIQGADALTTLSLSNSDQDLTVDAAVETLALTLDNVTAALDLDDSGDANNDSITTLSITASGSASDVDLEADAVTTATIAAAVDLDISDTPLAAVETVTITGAGDVALGDISGSATSVDASGSTGGVTVIVAGDTADVTGGEGNDAVTVDTDAVSKDISLGDGDDSLTLNADSTTLPTGTVAGGDGTDTMSMTITSALGYDDNTNFADAISGFERLTISDAAGDDDDSADTVTVDLEALGFSYVTSNGTVLDTTTAGNSDTLVFDNMASGGTVVLAASAAGADTVHTVNVKDAATGSADSLNIMAKAEDALDHGTITADDVESLVITATDINADDNDDGAVTLAANGDSVTAMTITGDADLTLTSNATAVTSVDASAMTGGLTYTANDGTTTVTGGAGADSLTAAGSGDTLIGGAGDDTITGADLTTLTGGEGVDTFMMNVPTNVNSYSTISDLSSGDIIDLDAGDAGTVVFTASAISLADTAVFQDYANSAVNALDTDTNDAAWFQYNGNTYIVQSGADHSAATGTPDFQNGTDSIIKITGEVDLSTASYNQDIGTLEIA